MKIAISVPDRVHRAAEEAARRLGLPRSRFYARAVEAFLRQASDEEVTERLNAVYGRDQVATPDPFLTNAAATRFRKTKW